MDATIREEISSMVQRFIAEFPVLSPMKLLQNVHTDYLKSSLELRWSILGQAVEFLVKKGSLIFSVVS